MTGWTQAVIGILVALLALQWIAVLVLIQWIERLEIKMTRLRNVNTRGRRAIMRYARWLRDRMDEREVDHEPYGVEIWEKIAEEPAEDE
jgi:hypothetical protein